MRNTPSRKYPDISVFERVADKFAIFESLASFGHQAPSSHNTQPWQFKIDLKRDEITVEIEPSRLLPASDHSGREMHISLGAAAKNIQLAAKAVGFSVTVTNLETGIKLGIIGEQSKILDRELLEAIITRSTCRHPFINKGLDKGFLDFLRTFDTENIRISYFDDRAKILQLSEIVGNATEAAFQDQNFTNELSNWIKPSNHKYEVGMPGYNLGIPKLLSYLMPFAIKKLNLKKMQKKMVSSLISSSAVILVISSNYDNEISWHEVGMILEEIFIQAEKAKIKLGIYAAAIEIGEYYKQLQQVVGTDFRPQVFLRLGYSEKDTCPSPRLEINKVLKV